MIRLFIYKNGLVLNLVIPFIIIVISQKDCVIEEMQFQQRPEGGAALRRSSTPCTHS